MYPSGTCIFRKKLEITLWQNAWFSVAKSIILQIANLALCELQLWQFMEAERQRGLKMGPGELNSSNKQEF